MPKALNIYSRVEHLEEGFCLLSPLTGQPRLLSADPPDLFLKKNNAAATEGQCPVRALTVASPHSGAMSPAVENLMHFWFPFSFFI